MGKAALACAAVVYACAGSSGSSSPGGSGSLTGVWDGVGTRLGTDAEHVTVDIGPDHFFATTGAITLSAQRTASGFLVAWHDENLDDWDEDSSFGLTAKSAPTLSLGAIPLNLSGSWTADDLDGAPSYGCSGSLSTTVNGACKGITSPALGGPKFPVWLPNPENDEVAGSRVSTAASIFGDLGGVWKLDQPEGRSCTVEFAGNSMNATCTGQSGTPKTLHVEVNGSVLSGYTSEGVEFSAQRR